MYKISVLAQPASNQALHLTDSAEGRLIPFSHCVPPHRQVSLGR
jgi:hypothetical protein